MQILPLEIQDERHELELVPLVNDAEDHCVAGRGDPEDGDL